MYNKQRPTVNEQKGGVAPEMVYTTTSTATSENTIQRQRNELRWQMSPVA